MNGCGWSGPDGAASRDQYGFYSQRMKNQPKHLLSSAFFFFKRETKNLDEQMFKYRQDTSSTKCLWTKTTRRRTNPSLRLPIGSPWCTHYRKADSEAVNLDWRPLKRRVTEEVAQDACGCPSGYKSTCHSCCETSECRYHLTLILHIMSQKLQPGWWRGMGKPEALLRLLLYSVCLCIPQFPIADTMGPDKILHYLRSILTCCRVGAEKGG